MKLKEILITAFVLAMPMLKLPTVRADTNKYTPQGTESIFASGFPYSMWGLAMSQPDNLDACGYCGSTLYKYSLDGR